MFAFLARYEAPLYSMAPETMNSGFASNYNQGCGLYTKCMSQSEKISLTSRQMKHINYQENYPTHASAAAKLISGHLQ